MRQTLLCALVPYVIPAEAGIQAPFLMLLVDVIIREIEIRLDWIGKRLAES